MSDTPFPLPYSAGQRARTNATDAAKDEIRNKLNTKDFDRGFERKPTPEEQIQKLIRSVPSFPKPTMAEQKTSTADMVRKIKKASALAIVSSDHAVEDSPNAGHVNENLGKSVAMTAVKTLSKRKSITDGNSRPLSKRMNARYMYEDEKSALKMGLKKLSALRENEKEITNNSETVSPNEKNKKPEKRGDLVTVNPKLNDNQ
jgi:hypothetical protein